MSEKGPGTESFEENAESQWEHSKKQDKGLMTKVASKHRIVLGMCFGPLPGVANMSKFTFVLVSQLNIETLLGMPLWRNTCVPQCGLSL